MGVDILRRRMVVGVRLVRNAGGRIVPAGVWRRFGCEDDDRIVFTAAGGFDFRCHGTVFHFMHLHLPFGFRKSFLNGIDDDVLIQVGLVEIRHGFRSRQADACGLALALDGGVLVNDLVACSRLFGLSQVDFADDAEDPVNLGVLRGHLAMSGTGRSTRWYDILRRAFATRTGLRNSRGDGGASTGLICWI